MLGYTVDGDGNLIGSDGPALLVFSVGLVPESNGDPYPDMGRTDWAPDGLQFVFDRLSVTGLEIGDIVTGAFPDSLPRPHGHFCTYGLLVTCG